MRQKTFFVTDAHLGSGADSRQREADLVRWLDTIEPEAKRVVMLGDIFDFWFTYKNAVPRGYVRLLGKMAQMADSGVEFHFFIGNHDMWMFDYLEKEIGAVMHDEPEVFEIDGKRFLIGHGDGLGHLDKQFDLLRKVFRSRFNQRLFALLPPSWTFPIALRWSDSNKVKHARQDTLRYLGDDREGIVLYCKERLEKEHFDYCVFGHRHTPLTMPLTQDCIYVNTGDWLFNRNYAVYSPESGKMTLLDFKG